MTSLQLYNAVSQNILIPWNKNEAEGWKGETGLVEADRGGFSTSRKLDYTIMLESWIFPRYILL